MTKIIKHYRYGLTLLLLLLSAIVPISLVLASEPLLRFERLSIEDGLPHASILAIHQDRQGFLWVGTADGLSRYDGYNFKVFKHNTDVPHSLSSNYILAIFEDNQGILWVGTDGGGLNRFNPETEQFTHYRFDASNTNSLSNDIVRVITEDQQGMLWIGTKNGLNRFNPNTEQFMRYHSDASNANSLSNNKVRALIEDDQGMLWVGTYGGGLNRFNPKTEQFTHYRFDASNPYSLSHDKVRIITQDRQGILWVGTWGGGLNRFNSKTEQFSHYRFDASKSGSLSNNYVWAITQGRQGSLWVGTRGGLNRLNSKTEQFSHYRFDATNPNSLSNDNALAIIEDDQGTFWVGTYGGGLNRFNPKAEFFGHSRLKSNNSSIDFVTAIMQDLLGDVWVGTYGDGLHSFNPKTKHTTHYRFDASNPNSLSDDIVLDMVEDNNGMLWIGTTKGLNRLNPKTKDFIHYRFDDNNPNSLSNDNVLAITQDSLGILWIGTTNGLNRFNPTTEQFLHYNVDISNPNSLNDDYVTEITEDNQGILWVGTKRGGLNRFNPKTEQFSHYRFNATNPNSLSNDMVLSIKQDKKGILWVGTINGLNRMNPLTGQFMRFTKQDGLPNNVINTIEEDNDGELWTSTSQGLSRFNSITGKFKNYDVGDGLQSNVFNNKASFKSKSGELFFGGIKGFNHFSPSKIKDDKQKPIVVFTDMRLLNQSVPIAPERGSEESKSRSTNHHFTLEKAINMTKKLTLSHLENLVSFEFSALHFGNPKKNKYAYQLQGFDNNWIATDYKNRRATYTNLPSGDYTLHVKASNPVGVWNEEGATLKITVLPPPWKTWWAYTIYSAIFIGLLFVFVRIQRNKVWFARNISAQLEHQVAERTLELQEANTQLEEASLTDQLTGLKNRRFLKNNIDNDITLVNRQYQNAKHGKSSDKPQGSDLIFLLIDLDHFKEVNDIYGHTAGDAVLIQIKTILEQVFRETDYLVRWGGEEFLVIARLSDRSNAAELAERLRQAVEKYSFNICNGKVIKKTCSIGFACYPFLQKEYAALEWARVVDVADHCLYAAKKSNRNAWVGLDTTANCMADDLFARVTGQTETLIQSKELQIFTSISEHDKIIW